MRVGVCGGFTFEARMLVGSAVSVKGGTIPLENTEQVKRVRKRGRIQSRLPRSPRRDYHVQGATGPGSLSFSRL